MMIISSPHNPVGKVFTAEELTKMGELCADNNVMLISDEIHQDIVFKGYEHICTSSLSDKIAQNTITCVAPSKTFNLAGLGFSALIIPDEDKRKKFQKYMDTKGIHGSNLLGITAGEAAYKYGKPWLNELLAYLEGNIDYMENFFKEHLPKIKMNRPQATYLAWLDFREYGYTQKELIDKMVKEAKLGLNDGSTFGAGGEGFMRINFACPRSTIEEAMKRMKKTF
jgi:cystathionine beta-lyase